MDLLLRPEVIKNDEKAIVSFLKKLNEEEKIEQIRK